MSRILCLGMSALDAIYRVPAIPRCPPRSWPPDSPNVAGAWPPTRASPSHGWAVRCPIGGVLASMIWAHASSGNWRTRASTCATVRRIPGCISPSAAILVADDGERLICAYNDPLLDHDATWLPRERIADFDAVLADVRWPAGAAVVLDAARMAGIPAVFDGDIGPPEALAGSRAARNSRRLFGAGTRAGFRDRRPWRRARAHRRNPSAEWSA